MAATTNCSVVSGKGCLLHRDSNQSAANTAMTVSTLVNRKRQLYMVTVKYSANVTANVTITLNSGEGSAWDTLLQTISLSAARDTVWIPNGEVPISSDDVIDVLAPAGGVGITSAVAIYTRIS